MKRTNLKVVLGIISICNIFKDNNLIAMGITPVKTISVARAWNDLLSGLALYPKDEYNKLDEFSYSEIITVEKDSEIKKEATYTAPNLPEGEYDLRVIVGNKHNSILGISDRLPISLSSAEDLVQINTDSCYLYELSKEEEKTATSFLIRSNEPVALSCQIKNLIQKEVKVLPAYEIYENSFYGEKKGEPNYFEEIILSPEEEKVVSWTLPAPATTNLQIIKLSLKTDSGYSNSITTKYALASEGKTARISNLFLDKASYGVNETINLTMLWSSSLNKDEVVLKALITDKKGQECLPEIVKTSPEIGSETLSGVASIKCKDPQVFVKIEDNDGNILAEDEILFVSDKKSANQVTDIVALSLIVILIVVGIIVFFVKPKDKKEELNNNQENNNENNL
ncbi:MAG: hypothetical protein ACOXZJ_04315 [Bacteroidales bacterium]